MSPKKKVRKKQKSQSPAAKKTIKKGKKLSPKKAGKKPARRKVARSASKAPNDVLVMKKGPGSRTAGQSGDIQGLSNRKSVDTESVEELAEEGQSFEASFLDGVENAPDPDEAEVTTKEVPEDDVPSEYLEEDE